MDKKQKTMLISILLILLLIVFLAGYTFAKYYSSYTAGANAQIAKWNFKVTDWSTTETEETETTITHITTLKIITLRRQMTSLRPI